MGNLAEQRTEKRDRTERGYTYADYLTWKGNIRYEIIDGTAYAMAAPSRLHQKVSVELLRQLANFLRGKSCEVYSAPFAVRLGIDSFDDTVVEPDLLVVCDESKHDGKSVKGAPDLIIEILSPFNTKHDTVTKARWYRKAGVREYWIVDPATKTVQVCILANGRYLISDYGDGDIISVHVLDGCEINLSEVFYDTIEATETENENDEQLELRNKIIQALKMSGVDMSDEQIEKAVKILDSGDYTNAN